MTGQSSSTGIYHPIHIPEWYIYDCFYSSSGELVIITAAEIVPFPRIWLVMDLVSKTEQEFRVDICPAKHTYVYRLSPLDAKQSSDLIDTEKQ